MNSVLVVAHNEESTIADCLESLGKQSRAPDEVVVIVHNSTDRTEQIARSFPVTVIPYDGPAGSIYARMKGFESVSGDIVACVDGDACASPEWLEGLVDTLRDPDVSLVGSRVMIHGTLTMRFASFRTFNVTYPLLALFGLRRLFFDVWGAGFAVRKADYEAIGGLAPLIHLHRSLGLSSSYWPDDFYLTLKLREKGRIAIASRSKVTVAGKEQGEGEALARAFHNQKSARRMMRHLGIRPL